MSADLVPIRTEEDRVGVVDRARAMLARARTPVEAKKVADLAAAAKRYAQLQKLSKEAVDHAHVIEIDALALMGEMLMLIEKNKGSPGPGRGHKGEKPVVASDRVLPPTLAEQGI